MCSQICNHPINQTEHKRIKVPSIQDMFAKENHFANISKHTMDFLLKLWSFYFISNLQLFKINYFFLPSLQYFPVTGIIFG